MMRGRGLWLLLWSLLVSIGAAAGACSRQSAPKSESAGAPSGVAAPAPSALFAGTCIRSSEPGCGEGLEVALLAGGCFWGMEDILRKVPGVVETSVGYSGGTTPRPSYDTVRTGQTGHAEAIRVVFDPKRIAYEELLEKWFFRMHDPTTVNRQGNDVGSQYRSAIFTTSDAQARVARDVKERVAASGKWPREIVTEITPATSFTPAEEYHQSYLQKNPGGYTCHFLRD